MNYLPIFANVSNKIILVVGGGEIAARKIKTLIKVRAKIQVIAKDLCHDLKLLCSQGRITWLDTNFNIIYLKNAFLIIAATNDKVLNQHIFNSANIHNKFVNVVDDIKKCNFIFPSIIDRSPLIVAISSSGTAPVLTSLLRAKLESILPNYIGKIAKLANKWRNKVKQHFKNVDHQRHFWQSIFNSVFVSKIASGNINEAQLILHNSLINKKTIHGEIILVGAGPGDSGLLTLRGLQVLQIADVVLYDHLVSNEILELIRKDADLIYVGKKAGLHSISQNETNYLLVKLARQGKCVVRLKGGDPFIFGRGGEELYIAYKYGIPFQVVPGITSAIGASAYAGIPLTHRQYAHSVIFITGHDNNKNINIINWSTLIKPYQTIVIYMGKMNASIITAELKLNSNNLKIPIAIIGRGTLRDQQVIIGTLDNLEKLFVQAISPTILIIGHVVNLHQNLAWFNKNNKQKLQYQSII